MPTTHLVDDEHAYIEHILHDIPVAVLECVEQMRPVPQDDIDVPNHARFTHVFLGVASAAHPSLHGFCHMGLACPIVATDDQLAASLRMIPNASAETANFILQLLELGIVVR